jgi:hypothetical protein
MSANAGDLQVKKHQFSWGTYFQRIVCRLGPDGHSIPAARSCRKLKSQLNLAGPNRAGMGLASWNRFLKYPFTTRAQAQPALQVPV